MTKKGTPKMILRFSAFLIRESKKISASGNEAQRHTDKYIKPNLIGRKSDPTQFHSNLTLNKPTQTGRNIVPSGSKLMPIAGSHQIIKGVHHHDFHAISPNGDVGIIKALPHSKVTPETSTTGKHNYEHAVIKTWNYFAKTHRGRHPEIAEMHAELEKAKSSPNHPLHISHANKSEFAHGLNGVGDEGSAEVKNRASGTYYNNMKDAAHTVKAMAEHHDFKQSWRENDIMTSSGMTRPSLSKLYSDHGVKGAGATAKADGVVMNPDPTATGKRKRHRAIKMISLKDNKGSQLMSSSPAEFHAIYHAAFNTMKTNGKISADQHRKMTQAGGTLHKIRKHLESGDHQSAQAALINVHRQHNVNGLNRAIHEEAISGKQKFNTEEGTATHVSTHGKGAKTQSVGEFLDDHEHWMSNPRAGAGKHGEGSTAVRLDTPTMPKTHKGQIERLESHKTEGSGPYAMPKAERESHIKKVMGGFFAKAKSVIGKFTGTKASTVPA